MTWGHGGKLHRSPPIYNYIAFLESPPSSFGTEEAKRPGFEKVGWAVYD